MRVVINDANILIDLIHLDLADLFFSVDGLELKTTDFVFEELHEEQKNVIGHFIHHQSLEIIESQDDDLIKIYQMHSSASGLSIEDCSVWYHAKKNQGILLTGDGKLRKHSSADGVEVRGILFVFDYLLKWDKLTFEVAILKLNQLYLLNDRLPIDAIKQRLECWARSEHIS